MNIKHFCLIVVFFVSSLICKSQSNNPIWKALTDTAIYALDTTLTDVNLDGKYYNAYFFKDKYSSSFEKYESKDNSLPVTIILVDAETKDLKFWKKFNANQVSLFKINNGNFTGLNQKGRLFIRAVQYGGGSGFNGKIFYFRTDENDIHSEEICEDTELSFILHSKKGDKMLVCKGLWNSDCHSCDHKYQLELISFSESYFDKNKIGTTILKYTATLNMEAENTQPFKKLIYSIKAKEPKLFTQINLSEFNYD